MLPLLLERPPRVPGNCQEGFPGNCQERVPVPQSWAAPHPVPNWGCGVGEGGAGAKRTQKNARIATRPFSLVSPEPTGRQIPGSCSRVPFPLSLFNLPTWTWVWVDSGSLWWTGRPGVLPFLGSQRVGHDWATELNWTELKGLWPTRSQSRTWLGVSHGPAVCCPRITSRPQLFLPSPWPCSGVSDHVLTCPRSLPRHISSYRGAVRILNGKPWTFQQPHPTPHSTQTEQPQSFPSIVLGELGVVFGEGIFPAKTEATFENPWGGYPRYFPAWLFCDRWFFFDEKNPWRVYPHFDPREILPRCPSPPSCGCSSKKIAKPLVSQTRVTIDPPNQRRWSNHWVPSWLPAMSQCPLKNQVFWKFPTACCLTPQGFGSDWPGL